VGPRCRGGGLAERPLQVRVAAAGLAGAGSDTPGEPRCLRSFCSERRLLVSSLVREALPAEPLVVAIDPGKVADRVWLASGGQGLIGVPLSLPTLREGVDELER